jgi:hypothetical protein
MFGSRRRAEEARAQVLIHAWPHLARAATKDRDAWIAMMMLAGPLGLSRGHWFEGDDLSPAAKRQLERCEEIVHA